MYIAVCGGQAEEPNGIDVLLCAGEAERNLPLHRKLFSKLSFVEAIGKRLYFNMTNGDVRETASSMKNYEDQRLSCPEFMRVHRSYIVNMLQVEELSPICIRTLPGAPDDFPADVWVGHHQADLSPAAPSPPAFRAGLWPEKAGGNVAFQWPQLRA